MYIRAVYIRAAYLRRARLKGREAAVTQQRVWVCFMWTGRSREARSC